MNLLSLYSKIQLKIEKTKKELRWLHSGGSPVEPECGTLQKGSTALKGLWNQQFLCLRLLFWQTLKIIIRFMALLFNDSSENYLIFTRLSKDSVFVCNNSYCQYKRFQKKVRFFSKTAFIGILVSTIITTGVLYFMLPGKPISQSASYSWAQNSWLNGADVAATALHPGDKTGWTKFYSKDASIEITGDGKVTLGSTSGSYIETSDDDFGAGTKDDNVYIVGGSIGLKKPLGVSCSFFNECDSGICDGGICASCGNNITFTYRGGSVTYGTVLHNDECWLDRNLGASQVAIAYNDSDAYGDLFQWGRLDDGHQSRTSGTTSTNSFTDNPGHSDFIKERIDPVDWRVPQNNNLWQGVNGINNPCPSGWRAPTNVELETECASWNTNDYNGAYASPLKLTAIGSRRYSTGQLVYTGSRGYYWGSSSFDFGSDGFRSGYLYFNNSAVSVIESGWRAKGYGVRCIRN